MTTETPPQRTTTTTTARNNLKRKLNEGTDAYSRIVTSTNLGRGSLSGWTTCPLCHPSPSSSSSSAFASSFIGCHTSTSKKKYALGRGIAMHLQQVHTPWKPGKAELSRRTRIRRRLQGVSHQMYKLYNTVNTGTTTSTTTNPILNDMPKLEKGESREEYYNRIVKQELGNDVWNRDGKVMPLTWDPSVQEQDTWNTRLLELVQQVEESASAAAIASSASAATSAHVLEHKTNDSITQFDKDEDEETVHAPNQTFNENGHCSNTTTSSSHTTSQPLKRQKVSTANSSNTNNEYIRAGLDRNGQKAQSYEKSLPPFLKVAAEGNLGQLKVTVQECIQKHNYEYENQSPVLPLSLPLSSAGASEKALAIRIQQLLETRDRNGSTAEHWAAGGGHLSCLKYLHQLSSMYVGISIQEVPVAQTTMCTTSARINCNTTCTESESDLQKTQHPRINTKALEKKKRRRDGKTCLHYAARNGHDTIIQYICNSSSTTGATTKLNVDLPSGDGTTPLHLACYGGHLTTIQLLVDIYNADLHRVNEWGCGVGHWTAMSIHSEPSSVVKVLDYLSSNTNRTSFDVFGTVQKQGHSAVHKASQKLNKHVIQWLAKEAKTEWTTSQRGKAGLPDAGRNKPSDIWCLCGGDESFAEWMRDSCGW